jgi:hypothetical protein
MLRDEMSENKKSENIIQSSLQVAEAILEKAPIYEDLAQPTAKAIGHGLGGALLYVMTPFIKMGMSAKQDIQDFQISLEQKTSNIPQERLQPPSITVAGPVVQALGYTIHEEPLREMFTSLLATAMDSETSMKAHPAFVEIIKQITPDEAKILRFLAEKGSSFSQQPVADVIFLLKDGSGFLSVTSNQSFIPEDAGCLHIDLGSQYLENLQRLNLIEISSNLRMADEESYSRLQDWFNGSDFGITEEHKTRGEAILQKKLMAKTSFGQQFINSCVL